MNDSYIYIIIALLPLAGGMLVTQTNPYHALVIRGVLGAVAALVDAILGAADVALTEALMGSMLATTLYAVAVRSSMVMRLGVIQDESIEAQDRDCEKIIDNLRAVVNKHYLRLEIVPYTNTQALQRALIDKEVHATISTAQSQQNGLGDGEKMHPYHTTTRIQRLYDIMQTELSTPQTILSYVNVSDLQEQHS
jgi:putative multicomponent Na+:H+ antiporter subunit B